MIPPRLVVATTNRGKVAELTALVLEWGTVEVLTLEAFPGVVCPEETGATYVENATLKARAVAAATGVAALTDDSGLEVDALAGAPGLHSARWAGVQASDQDRVRGLLAAVADVPDDRRTARFVCVAALAWPDGRVHFATGVVHGRIASAPAGEGGFGYDPVFLPDELAGTFASVPSADKARVSHRARAVRGLGLALRRCARPPVHVRDSQ